MTVVRGSAGSGKSTLLRQARAQNATDPRGIEVELVLREGDADASRLARRLGTALDLPDIDLDGPDAALDLVDQVAVRSPVSVCLHLDDVHRLGTETTGAQLLRELIDERPSNLTFVLATRGDLPIPLARRSATGDLVLIDGDQELFLDADELAEAGYDADVQLGWPVLLALDAAGRPGVGARDFLFEEIAADLGADERSVLALLAGAGELPVEFVEARYGAEVVETVSALPLIERTEAGLLTAHDLWADTLPAEAADRDGLIDVLIADAHFDRALTLAMEDGGHTSIDRVLLSAAIHHAPVFPPDTARRWLEQLDPSTHTTDAALLVQAAAGLTPIGEDLPTLDRLAAEWTAPEETPARLAVLAVSANRAYTADRLDRILEIRAELDQLEPPLPPFLEALRAGVDAVLADLRGDSAAAIDHLAAIDFDAVPPLLAEQLVRLYATNHVALGRASEAIPVVDQLLSGSQRSHVARTPHMLRWFAGDPGPVRTLEDTAPSAEVVGPDLVINRSFRTHLRAAVQRSLSDDSFTPQVLEAAGAIPRLRVMALVARAAAGVIAGDEEVAAADLARDLDALDTKEPMIALELWRFLPITAVLAPDAVDLDEAERSGPTHQRMVALTRLLLDGRRGGGRLATATAPTAAELITTFPLRWTIEFVCRARIARAAWAEPLTTELLDQIGVEARRALDDVASGGDAPLAAAAAQLLDETPRPPDGRLTIDVLGPLRLSRAGHEIDDPLLRRARVRQLVVLLAAHDGVRREELIDRLWPDATPESGAKNLRTNLTHVRRLLEPEIGPRAPSYFVRTTGDRIRLGGASLRTDLAQFERHLERATIADDRGDPTTALAGYEAASALWRGEPLVDVADVVGIEALQASLQRRAAFAASRAAEIRLARNDLPEATAMADRALKIAPYAESGHRVRLAALVAAGDVVGVQRALDRLQTYEKEGLVAVDDETRMVLRRARDLLDRSG